MLAQGILSQGILWLLLASPALAQGRDTATDALSGHAAEARQWAGTLDPHRRALFLDPVEVESGEVGLDCGHRRAAHPESVAGTGFVVLLETLESSPRRIRYFAPPGSLETLEEARRAARSFAEERVPGIGRREIAARSFSWCR